MPKFDRSKVTTNSFYGMSAQERLERIVGNQRSELVGKKEARREKRIAADAGNKLRWPHSHLAKRPIPNYAGSGSGVPLLGQRSGFKVPSPEKYLGQRMRYLQGAWKGD